MTTMHRPPWTVLGLDPAWFQGVAASATDDATRAALVRRAYRRALLQHHPDKQAGSSRSSATSSGYTVDEIKAAYAALGGGGHNRAAKLSLQLDGSSTVTGLEVVDLDELPSDELESHDGTSTQTWYRSCRCGNPRGFTFDEHDLEEELDAEAMETLAGEADNNSNNNSNAPTVGELMVGCQDCSLWLCVHFAAAPDDDDGSIQDQQ